MSHDSKLTGKIKSQIKRFSGRLCKGMTKTQTRFVTEMVYGIQASKDVKISNIGRALNESIPLIKTENRLCRNLAANPDLADHINKWLCREGGLAVTEETVLAIDIGDIRKRYAKKMEYLANIHDGSTGEIGAGYWLCQTVAANPRGDRIVPLHGELYSQNANNFVSENDQILRACLDIARATGKKGIITIDRGGDRRKILIPLLDNELDFVVRQKGDRHILLEDGRTMAEIDVANNCKTPYERELVVEKDGHLKVYHLQQGVIPVRLPECPDDQLYMVVIVGFGNKPIMLLANVKPKSTAGKYCDWISDIYLTRWKIEETYRFMKQGYNLEDVRVRSYAALRNIYALVNAVLYFVSVIIGAKSRMGFLYRELCRKAQRFFEISNFFQYALADGIFRLLWGARIGLKSPPPEPDTRQILLEFAPGI